MASGMATGQSARTFAQTLRKAAGRMACALATAGFAALAGVGSSTPATAEPLSYFMPEGVSYDEAVPTPDAQLGFGLGEAPVRHHAMVDYLSRVAESSERVTAETIGYSHEGRPILFFTVTSPENHARIDEIREAHLARLTGAADAPRAGDDQPMVLWINYGVHGAESSGMDAAIPALYHLAAAQDETTARQLDDAVILITAIFNPDGHTRRIEHVERFTGQRRITDPFHQQHQLWIEARTNHYWFDLNRQWLLQTQPESRAWLTKWHQWKPQVTADYHEMGSEATYYFHPGTPSRLNPLVPPRARELAVNIARFHADRLDKSGRLYFSEEVFDNYYVGKGSTYPQVNGSVGFLFEAGAARGGAVESQNGVRLYAENIRTHFRTTLTTIQGALANRDGIMAFQREFFQTSLREGARGDIRAYVVHSQGDEARMYHFLDLLERHDITVNRLARDLTVGETRYPAGESYIVSLNQRQATMIRSLFERISKFDDPVFYDVSTWTMPLLYGLTHDAVEAGAYSANLLGDAAEPAFPAATAADEAPYGYMFDWDEYYAPRALYRLLEAGVRTRASMAPVTVRTTQGEVEFGRGAVFVPYERQALDRATLKSLMARVAEEDGIEVHGVESGLTPTPGQDLGAGGSFATLKKPEILLLFDDGLSWYNSGEVWHLLDYRMRMPVTLARASRLGQADWSRYTHIILAGGSARGVAAHKERLTKWVREDGGTLIALADVSGDIQKLMAGGDQEDGSQAQDPVESDPQRHDFASRQARQAAAFIGGAIFESDLDVTHPLGFGYTRRFLATQRRGTHVLARPDNPYATVAQYVERPLLSGYASQENLDKLARTPSALALPQGRGAVILFADNLNFRATYFGTSKLFLNALFFSHLIQ